MNLTVSPLDDVFVLELEAAVISFSRIMSMGIRADTFRGRPVMGEGGRRGGAWQNQRIVDHII
jgi:hypothetical protein